MGTLLPFCVGAHGWVARICQLWKQSHLGAGCRQRKLLDVWGTQLPFRDAVNVFKFLLKLVIVFSLFCPKVQPEKHSLKMIKNYSVQVNWFVFLVRGYCMSLCRKLHVFVVRSFIILFAFLCSSLLSLKVLCFCCHPLDLEM